MITASVVNVLARIVETDDSSGRTWAKFFSPFVNSSNLTISSSQKPLVYPDG